MKYSPTKTIDSSETNPPPIIYASAAILINSKHEVLLAQRQADQVMPFYYEFPGGKLESGETPEECLLREAQEELGIVIEKFSPLTFISEDRGDYHVIVYLYLCQSWQNEAYGKEGQQTIWTSPNQLSNYNLLPANIPIIPHIINAISLLD